MRKVHGDLQRLNACDVQVCRGSMRINAWKTFVLRLEHPYIVRKLEKSLDMGELTFHAKKTALTDCSSKPCNTDMDSHVTCSKKAESERDGKCQGQ